jgi:hypothetical protein
VETGTLVGVVVTVLVVEDGVVMVVVVVETPAIDVDERGCWAL